MSSVYGYYSSSISKSSQASLGISGLVSGIDVDSTVEAMSSKTSSKISKVKQNLMKLEWKQSAYQEIGTLLTDFKDKYMSKTGASSISNLLANCYNITAEGENANAVSATGSPNILNNFSILGVSSLASTASFTSKSGITKAALSSDAINFSSDPVEKSTLEGKKLSVMVGGETISLEFGDEVITDDASLEAALKNAIDKSDADPSVKNKLSVEVKNGKITFSNADSSSTENIRINSSSSNATLLRVLGLKPKDQVGEGNTGTVDRNGTTVTGDAVDYTSMTKEVSFFKNLESGNKKFTLDLDGTKATVEFTSDMLTAIKNAGDNPPMGKSKNEAMADELVTQINNQLKRVYGDKVTAKAVEAGTDKDGNKTYGFELNVNSSNSILSVASGDSDVVGSSGVLGIKVGDANRLLLGSKLDEANFANGFDFGDDGTKTYDLKINDVSFTIGKDSITIDGKKTDYKNGVTMNNVISAINSSNANVTMSYLSTTDRFTITSTVSGASGDLNISGTFADKLFGGTVNSTNAQGGTYTEGKDAKMLVSFDGGNTVEEITRSSNSFKLDGLNLTLSDTFNTDATKENVENGSVKLDELKKSAVTFSKSVNKEDLTNAIKEMVDDYNEIIAKVMDYYKTKPDRDYQPLTEDMIKNEELTEDQANLYNDEAKKGILFGDSILRSLSDDLRTIFMGLSGIGISTSSDYKEYGKLSFDAEKFGAALEADAAGVAERFTNAGSGVLAKLDTLMDKYVNSSIAKPGLITQKSGLANSSLTQMNSLMYKEKESLNKQLKELKVKLQTQQDRYYSRFTAMEVALSKMNSQSGYLQSMMGSM